MPDRKHKLLSGIAFRNHRGSHLAIYGLKAEVCTVKPHIIFPHNLWPSRKYQAPHLRDHSPFRQHVLSEL